MRVWAVFKKSMKEQLRQPLVLGLTLILPAAFVLLYWMFFPGGGSTSYGVLVLNQDEGVYVDGEYSSAGQELVGALSDVRYQSGDALLQIIVMENQVEAEGRLRDHDGSLLLVITGDFSRRMMEFKEGDGEQASVLFVGDLANPYYSVAAIFCSAGIEAYMEDTLGLESPIAVEEKALGDSAGRSEFELYVPGLLVFSAVMLVYQASMVVASEVEAGTLHRMRMTRLSALEYLFGTSLALEAAGLAALVLALGTARFLGFTSEGPLFAALVVGGITCFAVIGTGLVVAAFSDTVSQAFLIANFPLVLYMFFTDVIYPIPAVPLFNIGGQRINLFDLLPPTHAVTALNKVFSLGSGWSEVRYEMTALVVLSVLTFMLGVWIFQKRKMRLEH